MVIRKGEKGETRKFESDMCDVCEVTKFDGNAKISFQNLSMNYRIRFSTFVKSGTESFVLGRVTVGVQEGDVISVVVSLLLAH